MNVEEEYVRLIFGLKLKQIRTENNLSLFGLSKLTGLSKSYLNEIEKGKKFPKTDKIVLLAKHLEVPYDQMVSLKLDKNLAPLGEILRSNILKEIPLELFGIQESNLIDIISNAPAKVNAFISTLIEIAKNYNLSRESFFLAALRSYQEANDNYFEDIEQQVTKFAKAYQLDLTKNIKVEELEEVLTEEYGYTIVRDALSPYKELKEIRSVYIPKQKKLLLSNQISDSQIAFIYSKELAYNYLNIADRLNTFSWIKFESFDQVHNNFIASYFAGALLIPKTRIIESIHSIFDQKKWNGAHFIETMESFGQSPEMFFHRLTNILPKFFNLKNLFFLRFTNKKESKAYYLSKELHITQQQAPHANEVHEHYCRRWSSIDILDKFDSDSKIQTEIQISEYPETQQQYLVISTVSPDPFKSNYNRSINIGLLLSNQLKNKVTFLEDKTIAQREVGITCERCAIENCNERVKPATVIEKRNKNKMIEAAIEKIMKEN